MKKLKKGKMDKGITLIALIITIIVLLILAVVAIRAVQGDGIIEHAKNARDEYGKAQVKEQTTLENYLGRIEENLTEGLQVTLADGTKVTLTKENFGEYLGKKVTNYVGQSSVTIGGAQYSVSPVYRLYYIDFDNKFGDGAGTVYLKADQGPTNYELPTTDTSADTAENIKIRNLNPSLYAKEVTPPTSTNVNMKAVTWLTNTTNWEGLKTTDKTMASKVNYVLGAPSLEMMMDSYNTHYNLTGETPDYADIPASPDTTRKKLFYKYASGAYGYQVGPNADSEVEYADYTSGNSVKTDSQIDSMYYPGGSSKYYWLASPSAFNSNGVMFVRGNGGGYVFSNSYYADGAFCPLVSLESDVLLELE